MYLEDAGLELRAVENLTRRRVKAEAIARSIPRRRVAELNVAAERFPYLTPDATMAVARSPSPLAAETFAMLGELSTRRWMRDHPAGIRYGERLVTRPMRRSKNGPAIGGYPHGWSTRDFERRQVGGGRRLTPEEIEERVATQTENVRRNRVLAGRTGRAREQEAMRDLDEEELEGIEQYRQELQRQGEVQYTPRQEEEESAGPGFVQQLQRATGTTPPVQVQQAGLVEEGITTAGRTGFMAMDFPVQEFQGQIRNLYGWTHGRHVDWTEPQSDFLISLQEGLESGNGLFVDPESEVAQERRRREAERGQIGGHNITLGRWVAEAAPFAADSKPWMLMSGAVDLGVQVLDPTAFLLGGLGKGVRARKLFANPALYEKAGLWSGVRRTIAGPDAYKFLDSKDGTKAVEWLTNNHSPFEVWRGLNRKVNFDLATELADTRTYDETRSILERVIGPEIREVGTLQHVGFGTDPFTGARLGLSKAARQGRPLDMPIRGPIDAHDKDVVGREIESWLYNVKGMDDATVERLVSRVARTTNHHELNATIRDALRDTKGILAREGIESPVLRSKLVRLHEETFEEGQRTWIDSATAQRQTTDTINVGGETAWDAGAHLYIEHAPKYLTLPDARRIRRVQSRFSHILTSEVGEDAGQLRLPWATLDWLQNEIWKPVTLGLRIAWPVRVIAEEQVRMAVAGYDSMFNHPISFIAGRIGKKAGNDIKGDMLSESKHAKEINVKTHGGWVDRAVTTGRRVPFHKNVHERDPYLKAWGSEIGKNANDPVAQYVARAESLEDAKIWFSRGAGNEFRGRLAMEHPDKFRTLEDADSYIESVARRISQNTGDNPELLDAVRTGQFRGRKVIDDDLHLDKDFLRDLDGLVDEFGPEALIGDETLVMGGSGLQRAVQKWDRAVDRWFGFLMSERTNNLSRNPVFRQAYWKEAERIIFYGDRDARDAIIRQAKVAKLDRSAISRMERATGQGQYTLEELDVLAKGQALDETKELLYDLTRKGRTMDAWRVVFPFGEAWREVTTRWFGRNGLLWQNPKTIRRFQQLLQGAQGAEFGEFMGAPDGKGFFWKNQWGEEVFMWPGTSLLTDKLLGVEVPLTGRVQGLSMFGTIMPGMGPVVQTPVGWFLQAKPGPEWLKGFISDGLGVELGPFGTVEEQVLPFGSIGAEDQAAIASAWSYAPPWVKNLGQAWTTGDLNGKQWNQAVMEMAGSLKATGEYGDSLDEQNRLLDDASRYARAFYVIKALAGTTAPAAPDGEWMIETNNGNVIRAAALSEELRALRNDPDVGFEDADQQFLEKYGPDIMAVISTGMTTSSVYEVPATRDGVAWVMAHPGIEDDLPNTYGFFAPEGGDEDFSLYSANFRKGGAIRLDPQDWIRLLNHTKGNVEYRKYVEEVGDQANTEAGEAYLSAKRDEIYERFPGWRDEQGKLNTAPDRTFIDELYRAQNMAAIRNTDAGRGLREYLAARDEVAAYAASQDPPLAWPGTSKAMLPGRLYLNEKGREIYGRHPGFKRLFDFILSRETEELEEVTGGP